MTMYGADTEALDALAGRLSGGADQLETIAAMLQYQVVHTQWGGGDDAVFQHDWRGRHLPNLLTTAEFLRHATIVVRQNAEQQRVASGILGPAAGLGVATGRVGGGTKPMSVGDVLEAGAIVAGLALSAMDIYDGYKGAKALRAARAAKLAGTAAKVGKDLSKFARVSGGVLGVVGGGLSIGEGISKLANPNATGTQLASGTLDVIGGTLGVVSGVLLLSGVGAPVAAVLGGISAVLGVASYIVENHREIAEFATKAAAAAKQAAENVAREAVRVAKQAARAARKAWKAFKFW